MERATENSFFSDSEKPDYSDREFGQEPDPEKDLERGAAPHSPAGSRAGSETQEDAAPEPAPVAAPAKAPGSGVPDGGWDAWLQVIGAWVILVDTWGLVNTFGVFQTYYETELLPGTSSSSISWIGSLQAALLMFVGVVSGPLYDAGYFRHLVASGLFLIVFGQFMTSLCKTYWQILLAQGLCIGIGMGLSFLPSAAILAQYFHKRRALVLGLSSTGSPIAGIVFPIIFSRLHPRIGFGWATRVIAFILLGISVVPVLFMKTRVPPAGKGKKRTIVDTTAFRDLPYMLFVAGCFFGFLVLYVAFFYTQLFDVTHHLSSLDFAPYTVTMLNVGSVFGRVAPNYLADKVGSLNVLIVCSATSAILLFGWMGIHNLGGLIVFALLYGLFSGGLVSVTPSVVMGLTPDLSKMGARMGVTFLASGVSILVGTPIAGAIVGDFTREEWLGVMGYAAAGLLICAALYLAARVILYRTRGGWRA